jgi:D-serine deaminase-like pyridoxal phosphate-dependent protein
MDQPSIMGGIKTKDLRTPALLLDLDSMESNLHRMASFFRDRPTKLRPHFKAHQALSLASEQLRLGANGISCARLEHAEALVHRGIENILIANEIAGQSMLERFVELSHQAPVIAAVDNPKVVADMAKMAGARAKELNVVVDLDVRLGRCGIRPGDAALSLTKLVLEKGLRFRGLMGYEGHIPVPAGPEKQRVVHTALKQLVDTKIMIEREGIPIEVISCGGTSDYSIAGTFPGVTEIQAGSYLLMDSWYVSYAPEFTPTLTILATVISKTSGERIVVDAGAKAMSGENGLSSVKGIPGLRVKAMYVEHTLIEIADPSVCVEVGDKIEIWVRYLDPTLNLHTHMYGIRNGEVEKVFPIEH